MSIVFKLENMTPTKAKRLLANNPMNRKVRQTWVDRLARMILEGQWVVSHQGIAISEDGGVLDGQHRLMAIVQANKAVKCYVAYNVPLNAIISMDQGIPRDVCDIAGPLSGGMDCGINKLGAAIARQMKIGFVGCKTTGAFNNNNEHLRYFLKHREAIEFSSTHIHQSKPSIRHSVVCAVISRAWYTCDRERLKQLCEVVCTGVSHGPQDSAAINLRNYFMSNRMLFHGSTGCRVLYRKCVSAFQAFLQFRSLSKIYEAPTELFPLPDDDEETDGPTPGMLPLSANDSNGVLRTSGRHRETWAARPDSNS